MIETMLLMGWFDAVVGVGLGMLFASAACLGSGVVVLVRGRR